MQLSVFAPDGRATHTPPPAACFVAVLVHFRVAIARPCFRSANPPLAWAVVMTATVAPKAEAKSEAKGWRCCGALKSVLDVVQGYALIADGHIAMDVSGLLRATRICGRHECVAEMCTTDVDTMVILGARGGPSHKRMIDGVVAGMEMIEQGIKGFVLVRPLSRQLRWAFVLWHAHQAQTTRRPRVAICEWAQRRQRRRQGGGSGGGPGGGDGGGCDGGDNGNAARSRSSLMACKFVRSPVLEPTMMHQSGAMDPGLTAAAWITTPSMEPTSDVPSNERLKLCQDPL